MTARDRQGASEDEVLARVLPMLGSSADVVVGPGHDCAVLRVGQHATVVVTTDVLVDGVHFDLERHGAEAAAAKALLVNLSDLAASAATPLACEVGVVLPASGEAEVLLEGLARGFERVGTRWGCPAVGGDTNVAAGPLVIALTALGRAPAGGAITRHGARPGDVLSVTGPLGGSLAGRHLDFVPRLAEATLLAQQGIPHAMMDLSDGLGRDLPRLCRASSVGASVDAARVPVHPDALGLGDDRGGLQHALEDGEDFELLLAHAPLSVSQTSALRHAGVVLHEIGRVVEPSAGLTLTEESGPRPWPATGFDHLARATDPDKLA